MMDAVSLPSIFDSHGLAAIRRQAATGDPAALKAAAQQFEALFLQMVLKSMREATPRAGLFDSDQSRLYESLLDQQMGQVLAAKGGMGLAKLIETQLSQHAGENGPAPLQHLPLSPARSSPAAAMPAGEGAAREFVVRVWPHAIEAARGLGLRPEFLVGQAALESGWGRAEPRHADGRSSHNLFGIKAGTGWTGDTVEAATLEYANGVPQRRVERFRAYGSYAEAFRDYASLLASPRYAAVLGASDPLSFAQGLQRAGYATDPAYAQKLARIIGGLPRATLA